MQSVYVDDKLEPPFFEEPDKIGPNNKILKDGHVMQVVLRIKEQINPSWQEWFEGLEITNEASKTEGSLLSGVLADQAALNGVLSKIFQLGLTLVSFERRYNETVRETKSRYKES